MKAYERPAGSRVYYKLMRDKYTQEEKETKELLESLIKENNKLHDLICDSLDEYKQDTGLDLNKYVEFVENRYKTGEFFKVAKGVVINKEDNYKLVGTKYDIYNLADTQKQIYDTQKKLAFIDKLLSLKYDAYRELLKVYYEEVQKHMILDGEGYDLPGRLGYLVIRRIKINKEATGKALDFAATKKRKEELLAEGKILYNKDDERYYKNHGLEYHGVDYRVYKTEDYCYNWTIITTYLKHYNLIKFLPADTRGSDIRGKSNEELLVLCDNDCDKIIKLNLDGKTKLQLCLRANNILYTKFIRNESQQIRING